METRPGPRPCGPCGPCAAAVVTPSVPMMAALTTVMTSRLRVAHPRTPAVVIVIVLRNALAPEAQRCHIPVQQAGRDMSWATNPLRRTSHAVDPGLRLRRNGHLF